MEISLRGRELIYAALVWLAEGVSPVPAMPRSKEVRLQWRNFEQVKPSPNSIYRWFYQGLNNLAVVCGTGGLLVLDFDHQAAYQSWCVKAGDLADTYSEKTCRGMHLFYKVDNPVTRRFQEAEALGLGHLCMVAPSVHPFGSMYEPYGDSGRGIKQVEIAELFFLLSEKDQAVSGDIHQAGTGNRPARSEMRSSIAGSGVVVRLKSAFPLYEYAASLTALDHSKSNERWYRGRCPLHDDKNPSFWVDVERQLWGCLSPSCRGNQGGDVINLFALANNITVNDAIGQLARKVL